MKTYLHITYDDQQRIFHLNAGQMSYIIQVYREGYLAHIYWSKKIQSYHGSCGLRFADRAFSPNPEATDRTFSLDTMPQEYPAYGNTDFRVPAVQVELPDGSRITDFRFYEFAISKGKPRLEGLPATYVEADDEAETLEITMKDSYYPIYLKLYYTVYKDSNVLTRSVKVENQMEAPIRLLKASSMNVDFREDDFQLLHLSGAWGRERDIVQKDLDFGVYQIESRRGASSHQHNPFLALLRKDTTETSGEVFGFSLVYSGNFLGQIEVDGFHNTRVNMGINPFDFSWLLAKGETFQTPEVVMVYSCEGLGGMSRTYHKLYQKRLCRGIYRDQIRPILINNWEATYFDFNAERIVSIAQQAQSLGIELLVLDDGWFGRRNDDRSSLGDWFVNLEKLPKGIDGLAKSINETGLKFGLWFEPEMISVDSDLYRKHPDWCLHVPNRNRSESRNQLVLDFSRAEVRHEIIGMLVAILESAPIAYVKWDMNRHMTEIGSPVLPADRQKEVAHRYILGLYEVLETITNRFPHILFESCSGGGGRYDPGMLYYMPQTWTSDNTDAVERLKIQYGTSLVYPISTMGAHVSAVPNHQVHRLTNIKMRGDVAMAGNLGYELDMTKLSEQELASISSQVEIYKTIRPVIQFGQFYRLLSPFTSNQASWMFVSEDGKRACVFYYKIKAYAQETFVNLRLQGLEKDFLYETVEGNLYGGDELMYGGIPIPALEGDYQSHLIVLNQRIYL